MRVALINTNRIKPPIAPVGLEYVGEALRAAGNEVDFLDLCWVDDWKVAVADFFHKSGYDLVGMTLRNTDDCAFDSQFSFLGEFREMAQAVRESAGCPVVLGGIGFSVMPELVLELSGANAGIWGDGEFALVEIVKRIEEKRDWSGLPNLVGRRNGKLFRNPARAWDLHKLPPMNRDLVDNKRYFREGGQIGFETKRGCSHQCIYCADPVAKGKKNRPRPPRAVADELERLYAQGIDYFHTCDSEFNTLPGHALEVCREIIRRGLGEKIHWYSYCAPAPFPGELAEALPRAGCVGINFGVDNGDPGMLKRLRRGFAPDDILNAVRLCKARGITVMFDLLLGSPGESRASVTGAIELMKRAEPDQVGVATGVRIYPGTELAGQVEKKKLGEGLTGGGGPFDPLFFLEPAVAPFLYDLLDELIGEDRRFLFMNPLKPARNYNYNANERLVEAIRNGQKGAYWDILRKVTS